MRSGSPSPGKGRSLLALALVGAGAVVIAAWSLRARPGPPAPAAPAACPVELKHFEVRGTSMAELFPPGADLTAEMGQFACAPPARGDVAIIALSWRADPIVKRVLALPGDRIALAPDAAGARLLVNDAALTTPAGVPYAFAGKREQMLRLYVDQFRGVMPAGVYLVFGTEVGGSLDSSQLGPVERAALVGRVRDRRR